MSGPPDLSAGACVNHAKPDIWFPERRKAAQTAADTAEALNTCGRCPVREACLADALAEEVDMPTGLRTGIRGGLTSKERGRLIRDMDPAAPS